MFTILSYVVSWVYKIFCVSVTLDLICLSSILILTKDLKSSEVFRASNPAVLQHYNSSYNPLKTLTVCSATGLISYLPVFLLQASGGGMITIKTVEF